MGRDLVEVPFGRFYYLPLELAKLGYDVSVVAISYRRNENFRSSTNGIDWHSISVSPNLPGTVTKLQRTIERISPDWIVGCSDTYFGILAEHIAGKLGCFSAIDAYDNYCAYIPWAKPLHYLWHRALSKCDLTFVAGPSLAELWAPLRRQKQSVIVPMAADPSGFYLRDRFRARHQAGLPPGLPIIGYAGSISKQRGIECLFEAISLARKKHTDLLLVLSGRLAPKLSLPPNTRYLGYIDDHAVPNLINCFDVMAVINKESKFGNYSFPVKLYEAMACRIPVVVSRTKSTEWILGEFPDLLVEPSDPVALSNGLLKALEYSRVDYSGTNTWRDSAERMHQAFSVVSETEERRQTS